MTITVRFAPSPTGLLHVGNARVAVMNWLFTRQRDGRFILRIDDTDAERSRPEYTAAITRDLSWLGLDWDLMQHQSERLERYAAVAEELKTSERLYACYETPEELETQRRRQLARGRPPVYDRAALRLTDADRSRLEAEGRSPHWRFLLEPRQVAWDDMVRGPCHYHAGHLSDPVLVRADGSPLYTLPSVVDDIDLGITHVIRGEDHVTNTAVQIQLMESLGSPPPTFAHIALLTDAGGQGFSKRLGSLSLEELRAESVEPTALAVYLATLGASTAVESTGGLRELASEYDIAAVGRASARFDDKELRHQSARRIHEMPTAEALPRLQTLGLADADAAFWEAVRPNLDRVPDAVGWWTICHGEITPVIDDKSFIAAALAILPPEPWNNSTWEHWTTAVRDATGQKGKNLFRPLRLALTGLDHGPEMKRLLPLMSRALVVTRLQA